jgi:hypothetical protein
VTASWHVYKVYVRATEREEVEISQRLQLALCTLKGRHTCERPWAVTHWLMSGADPEFELVLKSMSIPEALTTADERSFGPIAALVLGEAGLPSEPIDPPPRPDDVK